MPGDQRPETERFYEPWADPHRDYAPTPPPHSHAGAAGQVERGVLRVGRFVDRTQARLAPVAFLYAVLKKYADDEGSRLAALLAYYTFLGVFPLMIGGFAVLDLVLRDRPETVRRLVEEIVPQALQQQVISAYEGLPSSGPTLVFALVGLLLAGTGFVFALYAAVNQIFAVPYRFRYGFGPRYARVLLVVLLGGIGVLVVAISSGALGSLRGVPFVPRLGVFVITWAVASSVLYASVRLLCRRPLQPSELAPGAIVAGLTMTMSISLGSLVVARYIATSSAIYGAFATVVGVISVLFLVSNAIVASFEASVVRAWRLWPRGVDIHLLFPADERALALLVLMDERMPAQRNGVAFDATGHDDARRPDLRTLTSRPQGIPRTPYDVEVPTGDAASDDESASPAS